NYLYYLYYYYFKCLAFIFHIKSFVHKLIYLVNIQNIKKYIKFCKINLLTFNKKFKLSTLWISGRKYLAIAFKNARIRYVRNRRRKNYMLRDYYRKNWIKRIFFSRLMNLFFF